MHGTIRGEAMGAPGNPAQNGIRSTRPGAAALLRDHDAAARDAPAVPAGATPRMLIAPEFDAAHYLDNNEDVRFSGMDPFEHFLTHGAAELRNPNAWFDIGFYVRNNADVVDAEVNPFWHYLAHGKAEGRQPAPRRQAERMALAQAAPATARWVGPPPGDRPQAPDVLRASVAERLAGTAGLTVSVSHDRYTQSVGGVQILVADEQAAFNARNETYLHIAPAIPRLMLAPPEGDLPIHLTMDGAYCGLTTYADLARVLAELAPVMPAARRFVVHCLLGHQIDPLIALHGAFRPAAAVFWANDYEAACVGYNLLRNDVTFCGGPPPGSMACRICVYGEDRDEHLAQVGRLFAAVPFHVVAPSEAALAVWNAAVHLPYASVQVHEYARVRPGVARYGLIGASPRGTPDNPVRVGFVGFASTNKGWPAFAQIAGALCGLESYRLFHFTALAADPPLPGVETVPAKVSFDARGAMTDALVAASIDLVLVLSPWPETFCLVAYEAVAAGADVITLPESGNVADMVLARGRGLVMPDAAAITAFFTSEAAIAYVRLCGDQGSEMGRLESRGMTATLAIPDAAPGAARPAA